MLAKQDRIFIARWMRAPLRIGAVAPSGPALARLMAKQVDPARPGLVVELGAGTGVITAALLDAGVAPERLVIFERDDALCAWLKNRFKHANILQDDAVNLSERLAALGGGPVNAVVSSLPLLSVAPRKRHAIIEQMLTAVEPDGVLVQFTYGPRCPLPRTLVAGHGFEARPAGIAWLNLPPATIWRIGKAKGRANGAKAHI